MMADSLYCGDGDGAVDQVWISKEVIQPGEADFAGFEDAAYCGDSGDVLNGVKLGVTSSPAG